MGKARGNQQNREGAPKNEPAQTNAAEINSGEVLANKSSKVAEGTAAEKSVVVGGGSALDANSRSVFEGGSILLSEEVERRVQTQEAEIETRDRLAMFLVKILAGSIVLHYIVVAVFMYKCSTTDKLSESLSNIFNAWLPVLSGLVGAAVTYYFTRQDASRR